MFSKVFCPSRAVTHASSTLVGRQRELDALDTIVANVTDEHGALVLRGGVGVGKSSLLLEARHRAERDGVRVLSMSGVRSEMGVAFAGLHRILRPLLHSAPGLPGPQRDALLSTFGVREGQPQEEFLVALAALELLADEGGRNPVLVAIDDAHWLDHPTVDVLGLVARRLGSEPVGLDLAVRDGY